MENKTQHRKKTIRYLLIATALLVLVVAGCSPASFGTKPGASDTAQSEAVVADNTPSAEPAALASSGTGSQTGRLIFIGDSRTIDMFYDSDEEIAGEEHDGVLVYGGHGCPYEYLEALVEVIPVTKDDTLVTWMGANDRGNFPPYGALYNRLLEEGVRLVVCTVGPTGSDLAEVWYNEPYDNKYMQQFNTGLIAWAAQNNVPVIDLYSYVSRNVEIDMTDGVHYLPRPDPVLWGYILEKLSACGVR